MINLAMDLSPEIIGQDQAQTLPQTPGNLTNASKALFFRAYSSPKIVTNPCQLHVNFMSTSCHPCQLHVNFMSTSCQLHVNFMSPMSTSCHPCQLHVTWCQLHVKGLLQALVSLWLLYSTDDIIHHQFWWTSKSMSFFLSLTVCVCFLVFFVSLLKLMEVRWVFANTCTIDISCWI